MAFVIDTFIQAVIYIAVFIGAAILGIGLAVLDASAWAVAAFIITMFVVYWGYFAAFEALRGGQTPGKKVVGIRVIKDSGRAIKPSEAIARNLMRVIDQIPGVYLFGLVSMLISKEKKRLGDYVAGTVVVHEKSVEEVSPDLASLDVQQLSGTTVSVSSMAQLTLSDLELIESFLHRRLSLDSSVRAATAIRISEHIQRKLGEGPASGQSTEDFLNAVAISIRNRPR